MQSAQPGWHKHHLPPAVLCQVTARFCAMTGTAELKSLNNSTLVFGELKHQVRIQRTVCYNFPFLVAHEQ